MRYVSLTACTRKAASDKRVGTVLKKPVPPGTGQSLSADIVEEQR